MHPSAQNPYVVETRTPQELQISVGARPKGLSMDHTQKLLKAFEKEASKRNNQADFDNEEVHMHADYIMKRLLMHSHQSQKNNDIRLNNVIKRFVNVYDKVVNKFWYA